MEDTLPLLEQIVSGGQAGVDRAALDVAIRRGIPHGGFCPKGRWAEDGAIAAVYRLVETASEDPAERTRRNVECSDGTLLVFRGEMKGGTFYTRQYCHETGKPCLSFSLDDPLDRAPADFDRWRRAHRVRILNVAGPRESQCPGVYQAAVSLLEKLLA